MKVAEHIIEGQEAQELLRSSLAVVRRNRPAPLLVVSNSIAVVALASYACFLVKVLLMVMAGRAPSRFVAGGAIYLLMTVGMALGLLMMTIAVSAGGDDRMVQHRCLGMHRRSHAISEVSAIRVSGAGLDRRSRFWWGSGVYVRVVFKDGRRMGVGSEFAGILVQKIRSRMLR